MRPPLRLHQFSKIDTIDARAPLLSIKCYTLYRTGDNQTALVLEAFCMQPFFRKDDEHEFLPHFIVHVLIRLRSIGSRGEKLMVQCIFSREPFRRFESHE